MKKIFMLFGATLALSTASYAQTMTEAGNLIVDPYIGTMQSNILRSEPSLGEGQTISNYRLNGGQFGYGLRAEYMLADNFGLGVDFNYVKSGSNYDVTQEEYDTTSMTNVMRTYNYDYTSVRIRAMLRMNYHFVQTDNVDAYTGFAVGYKHANREWTVEDPNANTDGLEQDRALIPMAIRLSLGTRIYFTDNIGMMIEIGAGGGTPLQLGLSVKI
ncbi:MAG: outer membrane beta-barrel protein [Fluviicola sp.]